MNINSISKTNFGATIINTAEYQDFKDHLMFEKGNTLEEFREWQKEIESLPDAELAIDTFEKDECNNYIFGTIYRPNGTEEQFEYIHPDSYNTLELFMKKVISSIKGEKEIYDDKPIEYLA